jgi:hypothetical protein
MIASYIRDGPSGGATGTVACLAPPGAARPGVRMDASHRCSWLPAVSCQIPRTLPAGPAKSGPQDALGARGRDGLPSAGCAGEHNASINSSLHRRQIPRHGLRRTDQPLPHVLNVEAGDCPAGRHRSSGADPGRRSLGGREASLPHTHRPAWSGAQIKPFCNQADICVPSDCWAVTAGRKTSPLRWTHLFRF